MTSMDKRSFLMYVELANVWKRMKKRGRMWEDFYVFKERVLWELARDLVAGEYAHGEYRKFEVREKKRRDIFVAEPRDRVVQRWAYECLVEKWDKRFDGDVWSNRKGKGLERCLLRVRKLLQRYGDGAYIWRGDVTKFFDNVSHEVLYGQLSRVEVAEILGRAVLEIIKSYEVKPGVGIPIGNVTSQVLSNVYMSEWDRFARGELRAMAYVRYGDDFLCFFRTRREAEEGRRSGKVFFEGKLRLEVNGKNDVIFGTGEPVHFCGHVITKGYIVVGKRTSGAVTERVNVGNIASYKSLRVVREVKDGINYKVLRGIEGVYYESAIDFFGEA